MLTFYLLKILCVFIFCFLLAISHLMNAFLDMIFNEDAILLSLFERYADEEDLEELRKAVIKYCKGSSLDNNRPGTIDAPKVDPDDIETVIYSQIQKGRPRVPPTVQLT